MDLLCWFYKILWLFPKLISSQRICIKHHFDLLLWELGQHQTPDLCCPLSSEGNLTLLCSHFLRLKIKLVEKVLILLPWSDARPQISHLLTVGFIQFSEYTFFRDFSWDSTEHTTFWFPAKLFQSSFLIQSLRLTLNSGKIPGWYSLLWSSVSHPVKKK